MVTSAARPSAPSAAAANDVAIEKKMTVPPFAVARIAPCSQPGTSTQTTVMSAGPPSAAVTASASATGSRASASATDVGEAGSRSRSASCCTGTMPTVFGAPARRAAASDSEPDLPAPPITATVGAAYPCDDARGQCGRAAHVQDRQRQLRVKIIGQYGGDRPSEQDRVTGGRHLLAHPVPAGQPVGDRQRRQRERDQRGDPVADREARAANRGRPRRRCRSACRPSR